MNVFITSAARKREEEEILRRFPPPIWAPPANPKRFGNGKTVVCGIVVEDSRPQPTIESQSHCRGEFPRVNHAWPIELSTEGYDLIEELIAYWLIDQEDSEMAKGWAKSAGRAIARYEIWARQQERQCKRLSPFADRWQKEQRQPMIEKNGGKPKKNGKSDAATQYAKDAMVQLVRLYKGEIDFIDGELKEVKNVKSSLKIVKPTIQHPAINPGAIKFQVMDLLEGPIPSYYRRDVGEYFRIQEGSGVSLVFFHKDQPDTKVTIGNWSIVPGGRHRWHLDENFSDQLDALYKELDLPIIKRTKEALPV